MQYYPAFFIPEIPEFDDTHTYDKAMEEIDTLIALDNKQAKKKSGGIENYLISDYLYRTKQLFNLALGTTRPNIECLNEYLLYDLWDKETALILIIGYDPRRTSLHGTYDSITDTTTYKFFRLDGLHTHYNAEVLAEIQHIYHRSELLMEIVGGIESDAIQHLLDTYNFLERLWNSGEHNEKSAPSYYVEWALSKGIEIPWLEEAISADCLQGIAFTTAECKTPHRLQINTPKRKDDWYDCIEAYAYDFYREYMIPPSEAQLWNYLYTAKNLGWIITPNKKGGLTLSGNTLDREAFSKRYKKYFTPDTPDNGK